LRTHIALPATLLLGLAHQAAAQTPRLEDATIDGRGGHLNIVRLPIDINGKTVYRDITLDFKVDAKGDVSIVSNVAQPRGGAGGSVVAVAPTTISPIVVSKPSIPPTAQNFHSGTYRGTDGTAYHLAKNGIPFGGDLPEWQLTVLGPGGHVLDGATWYDGAIDKSPVRRRLRNAGITSEALSYGVSDTGSGLGFEDGALLGATAVGNVLTVYSFHKGCCTDTHDALHVVHFELVSED